jgi:hypothetical protein
MVHPQGSFHNLIHSTIAGVGDSSTNTRDGAALP